MPTATDQPEHTNMDQVELIPHQFNLMWYQLWVIPVFPDKDPTVSADAPSGGADVFIEYLQVFASSQADGASG